MYHPKAVLSPLLKTAVEKSLIAVITSVTFIVSTILGPFNAIADNTLLLPQPGVVVNLSPIFTPLMVKGLKINPKDPFQFDFIVNQGEENLSETRFKEESLKLVKYFLASLAIPDNDLWVNLSPYEKNRITTPELGVTGMGRDLLSQDYVLKQLTSSLIYPEGETGKKFWAKVYALAEEKYHTTNIPINTFNKVWIVPQKAVVYENSTNQTAYVLESKLKVMLEQDYLALKKHEGQTDNVLSPTRDDIASVGANIVREIVIPELTKEVNYGKNFANLRQITNSLILAAWFKRALKASILGRLYVDQKKISGVDLEDKTITEQIFQKYLKAYKKGVYNYIKEDEDPVTHETIPRKYFSGGVVERFIVGKNLEIKNSWDPAQVSGDENDRAVTIKLDAAMISGTKKEDDRDSRKIQNEQKAATVRGIFQPLFDLVKQRLEQYGSPLDTPEKQQEFGNLHKDEVQHWLIANRPSIENILALIPEPKSFERYKRNLILHLEIPGLGLISLFVHKANTDTGTGPHFHGIGEVKEVGEMAFVTALDEGLVETRFKNTNHKSGETNVLLVNPTTTELGPFQVCVLVDATYGAHRIEYLPTKVLGYSSLNKRSAAFLELYIYPESLPGFDSLFKLGPSDDGLHLIIRSGSPDWIKSAYSVKAVSRKEKWSRVTNPTVAVDEILESLSTSSQRPFVAFIYEGDENRNAYAVLPNADEIREAFNNIKSGDKIYRDGLHRYYLIDKTGSAGDFAMTTLQSYDIARPQELENPQLSSIMADGIIRREFYRHTPEELRNIQNQKWGQSENGIPVSDVVVIGTGPFGLSTAAHLAAAGLKVGVYEAESIANSFSDAKQANPGLRTPAFRISIVQPGYSPNVLLQNLYMPTFLSKYRENATKARTVITELTGKKFVGIAPGTDNWVNPLANIPVTRAEYFQHLLDVAQWINQNKLATINESDKVISKELLPNGLTRITTASGYQQDTRYVVDSTGFVGTYAQYEKVPDVVSALAEAHTDLFTHIFNLNDANRILSPDEFKQRPPIITSSNFNHPFIQDYFRSLPEGSSVAVAGGGLSAANIIVGTHNIRPDLNVYAFTNEEFTKHPSQMQVGFRIPSLIHQLYEEPDLRQVALNVWKEHGTPITPPVYENINSRIQEKPSPDHQGAVYVIPGVYFDARNYELEPFKKDDGTVWIRIFRKYESSQDLVAEINGGIISAIGWDEKRLHTDIGNRYGADYVELDPKGQIKLLPDGLRSAGNPNLFFDGPVTIQSPINTSAHDAPIEARKITNIILVINEPRLTEEELIKKFQDEYEGIDYVQSPLARHYLLLSAQQPGKNSEEIRKLYQKAYEFKQSEEVAAKLVWDGVQPGFDLDRVIGEYKENISPTDSSRDAIIDRINAVNQPGQSRASIGDLFDEIDQTTQSSFATEQLLYPATQLGVGFERTLRLYNEFKKTYSTEIAATLVRAAIAYFPQTTVNATKDAALIATVGHLKKIVDQNQIDPGGIDLSHQNEILQIKRDGNGFPLPVQFQDLAMIHINGLSPEIVRTTRIADLPAFLGVK